MRVLFVSAVMRAEPAPAPKRSLPVPVAPAGLGLENSPAAVMRARAVPAEFCHSCRSADCVALLPLTMTATLASAPGWKVWGAVQVLAWARLSAATTAPVVGAIVKVPSALLTLVTAPTGWAYQPLVPLALVP